MPPSRRQLGAAAAAAAAGLGLPAGAYGSVPPRRPDQYIGPGGGALLPPTQPGVFSRLVIGGDFIINQNGAFFYNPVTGPGLGDLIFSISAGITTDPYTNPVQAGATTYNNAANLYAQLVGGSVQVASTNFAGQLPGKFFVASQSATNQVTSIESGGPSGGTQAIVSLTGVSSGNPIVTISGSAGLGSNARVVIGGSGASAPAALVEIQGQTVIDSGGLVVSAGGLAVTGGETVDTLNVNGGKGGNIFAVGVGPSDFAGTVYLEDSAAPATPGTAAALYAFNGQLKYVGQDGNAYNTGRFTAFATGQTINAVAMTAIAGMSAAVINNLRYRFRILIEMFVNQAAGQWSIEVLGPAITSLSYGFKFTSATGTIGLNVNETAFSTVFAGPAVSQNAAYWIELEGQFVASAAGTLSVSGATSVAADTWTIYTASYLELLPVA